jgi:integrase
MDEAAERGMMLLFCVFVFPQTTVPSQDASLQSSSGSPVEGQNAARSYIRPACKKLGIVIAGWCDFRHTLTTKMRKDGRHPRVIADILGHSKVDLAMNTYDRSDTNDVGMALLGRKANLVTSGNGLKEQNA